jgi:hypothetical protein
MLVRVRIKSNSYWQSQDRNKIEASSTSEDAQAKYKMSKPNLSHLRDDIRSVACDED